MNKGLYKGGGDGLSLAKKTKMQKGRGRATFLGEGKAAENLLGKERKERTRRKKGAGEDAGGEGDKEGDGGGGFGVGGGTQEEKKDGKEGWLGK